MKKSLVKNVLLPSFLAIVLILIFVIGFYWVKLNVTDKKTSLKQAIHELSAPTPTPEPEPEFNNQEKDNLYKLINQYRESKGLRMLSINPYLERSSQAKLNDVKIKKYWSHEDPSGVMPWHFFKESGYYYTWAGENEAKGYNTAKDVLIAWENSPEHNRVLLDKHYTDMGLSYNCKIVLDGDTSECVIILHVGS